VRHLHPSMRRVLGVVNGTYIQYQQALETASADGRRCRIFLRGEGGGARDACEDGMHAWVHVYTLMHMGSVSSFPMASCAVFSLLTCAHRSDAQACQTLCAHSHTNGFRTLGVRNPEVALSPVPYSPSATIWCESFFLNMRACSLSPFRRFNSLFFLFDLHAAPCSQRPTTRHPDRHTQTHRHTDYKQYVHSIAPCRSSLYACTLATHASQR
jgi:hypothetical protein